MSGTYHRSAFKNWISTPGQVENDPIPPDKVDDYVNALKFSSSMLISGKFKHTDLFFYSTPKDFEEAVEVILAAKNFNLVNKSTKGAYAEALDYYLQFLHEVGQPACWLFSANPRVYDIISAIQELSVIPWKLDKIDSMIKKNDRVFLWIPGVDGGIGASGTIMGSPENHEPLRNDPFAIGAFLRLNSFLGVDIRIDKRYANPVVKRNLLLADDVAKTLEVFAFPGVPYYQVTEEQEAAIDNIIEHHYTAAPPAAAPAVEKAPKARTASAQTTPEPKDSDSSKPMPTRKKTSQAVGTPAAADIFTPAEEKQPALTEELIDPIDEFDEEVKSTGRRYWIFSPPDNARVWEEYYTHGFIALGFDALGDLKQFSSIESIKKGMQATFGSGRNYKYLGYAAWQFSREMQIGDIVYFGSGPRNILGRGIVKSDYAFDWSRKDHKNVRDIAWTNRGEWAPDPVLTRRTLVDITNLTGYCHLLEDMISDSSDADIGDDFDSDYIAPYSKEDFLKEAFMDESDYEELKYLVLSRKNVVITGVPGVGKTFLAERLAYSIIGGKDYDRVKSIQFHSGYSYDNFVMGYAPDVHQDGLLTGVFYDFCKEAEPDEREYFFLIDDISRGDIGNIFGDLLMLIGRDDRGKKIRLLYRDEQFSIPDNVHIIATMNGESESTGMDYSVRRRFAFYHINPAFDKKAFTHYIKKQSSPKLEKIVKIISEMNKSLSSEASLFHVRAVGHGYFCGKQELNDTNINAVAKYELIPLIRELFADNPEQSKVWVGKIASAIKS